VVGRRVVAVLLDGAVLAGVAVVVVLLVVVVEVTLVLGGWGRAVVDTETETEEEATDGGLEGLGLTFVAVVDLERREEKMLAGL
jgi:hypothetical protein